eukprot:scaffold7342_cov117-Isochrysis_galbana.AAC.2
MGSTGFRLRRWIAWLSSITSFRRCCTVSSCWAWLSTWRCEPNRHGRGEAAALWGEGGAALLPWPWTLQRAAPDHVQPASPPPTRPVALYRCRLRPRSSPRSRPPALRRRLPSPRPPILSPRSPSPRAAHGGLLVRCSSVPWPAASATSRRSPTGPPCRTQSLTLASGSTVGADRPELSLALQQPRRLGSRRLRRALGPCASAQSLEACEHRACGMPVANIDALAYCLRGRSSPAHVATQ